LKLNSEEKQKDRNMQNESTKEELEELKKIATNSI
jgi:hypothetical protein